MAALLKALFLFVFVFFSLSEAREILVGGKTNAWKIPSSPAQSLNQWAESSRFRVGDTLVLKVRKEDYEACNITNPQEKLEDGSAKVELHNPGPIYFISGVKGHCEQGLKLVVVVMTPRHRFIGISPAPSPAEIEAPAVAPSSGAASLKANKHTILLMQTSHNRSTRTFMDYDSISQSMDGICGLYERKLKDLNPAIRNITYDIADLYNFIDGLTDMSALVYAAFTLSLFSPSPLLKNKNRTFRAVGRTTVLPTIFKIFEHSIQGYLPYDRQWIKQKIFQHLKKLAH
ncbi:Enhancer of rudimentary-like protein [Cucurbita argyrosperma subsp. argyrosperma]|nr:Enhancer of rudimentary-like protein [Cucurbita argyrosperma subsp. argyrosperma]